MKRKYETALTELLRRYKDSSSPGVSERSCPLLLTRQADFEYLAAKGYIILNKDFSTNKILSAQLTESGIYYFDDKHDKTVQFWKTFFTNFLSGYLLGVASGLTVQYFIKILFQ